MKINYIIFLLIIEAFLFITFAQSIDNGFKIVNETLNKINYEDINCEKYKDSPKDRLGNPLSLYGINFNERDALTTLEKSIFNPEERTQIQKYGKRPALAIFKIEATSGKIVCVSFTFRDVNEFFSINIRKLAKYREEIKRKIKYDYLSFEGGDEVAAGYIYQIMPVFID